MKRAAPEREKLNLYTALLRLSGLGAVLAGTLFAVWGYIDTGGEAEPILFISVSRTTAHLLINVLAFFVPLLFIAGLAGLYSRCEARDGLLVRAGFVFSFTAAAWGSVQSIWRGSIATELVGWTKNPQLFAAWGSVVSIWHGFFVRLLDWLPLLFLGLLLLGAGITQKKSLRRWGVTLVASGAFGWVYYLSDNSSGIVDIRSIHVVFGVLFSLSWVVLGCLLWPKQKIANNELQ